MAEPRAAEQRAVRLEIETRCTQCGATPPVDGLLLRVMCRCGAPIELARPNWKELLTEIDRMSFDQKVSEGQPQVAEVANSTGRLFARWRPSLPSCDGCGTPRELVEPGSTGSLTCARCTKAVESFAAPLWIRSELLTAMQLYGAARDDEHGSGRLEHHFWLTFQGTPPELLDQHKQAIDSAIGPPPPSGTVTVISRKSGWRWEYLVILLALGSIGAAVHRCGRLLDDAPVEDVESTTP
jgi:hypothetical protein